MAFIILKTFFFKNKKPFTFAFLFYFVYLLPTRSNNRSHVTFSLSQKSASLQNLIYHINSSLQITILAFYTGHNWT